MSGHGQLFFFLFRNVRRNIIYKDTSDSRTNISQNKFVIHITVSEGLLFNAK